MRKRESVCLCVCFCLSVCMILCMYMCLLLSFCVCVCVCVCVCMCACVCQSPPAQQQLGVVLALQVLVDEVREELLEDSGGVLHLALQRGHDEGGHVAAVAHGERALRLQRTDEAQQEVLLGQELAEKRQ